MELEPLPGKFSYIILYFLLLYFLILYYITLFYITLYFPILYFLSLYFIILYFNIILYYTILYYIFLYFLIFSYIFLYFSYIFLYFLILFLYYIILYYIIVYYSTCGWDLSLRLRAWQKQLLRSGHGFQLARLPSSQVRKQVQFPVIPKDPEPNAPCPKPCRGCASHRRIPRTGASRGNTAVRSTYNTKTMLPSAVPRSAESPWHLLRTIARVMPAHGSLALNRGRRVEFSRLKRGNAACSCMRLSRHAHSRNRKFTRTPKSSAFVRVSCQGFLRSESHQVSQLGRA